MEKKTFLPFLMFQKRISTMTSNGNSWIFITLFFVQASAHEHFTEYYHLNLFDDKLCLTSAVQLKGVFPSLAKCAIRCTATDDCYSFFYASLDLECFSMNTVLTSRDGCETRSGSRYFSRQSDSDCYTFTQADLNQINSSSVTTKELCESYSFHVYTAGDNQKNKGCRSCDCCQRKGCFNGHPRQYNGTWSQTKSGRPCQRWDSQIPHSHGRNYPYNFPLDASVFDAHNYCRDPDNADPLWCYTEDAGERWEYCDIQEC